MKGILFILLIIGMYVVTGNRDYQDQIWMIACENSEGIYIIEYVAPERYDWIEEVHMCEE